MGVPVQTNEIGLRNPPLQSLQASQERILVLGPSSTFGWGVPEEKTYARTLEKRLRQYMHSQVSIINAGQIGFSSWQGVRFYQQELQQLHPTVLVIAYGVNDVDRHRFFYNNDQPDPIALPPETYSYDRNLDLLLFPQVIPRHIRLFLFKRFGCPGNQRETSLLIPHRVPEESFAEQIETLVREGTRDKTDLILMTSPFGLLPYPPTLSPAATNARSALQNGKRAMEAQKWEEALTHFQESLKWDPRQCDIHYFRSTCYSRMRDCRRAREAFRKALEEEPHRVAGDILIYNDIMRALAREAGAFIVDAERLLPPGADNLFLDPVHPTAIGHERIAQALLDAILHMREIHP
jgi:lysophospholipase L1-like esterase